MIWLRYESLRGNYEPTLYFRKRTIEEEHEEKRTENTEDTMIIVTTAYGYLETVKKNTGR